jgi:beta-glucosidase
MGGWTRGWQGPSGDDGPAAVTVLDGIEAAVSGSTEVEHRPTGYTWRPFGEDGETFENPDEVREAAADADAAVLVLGEGPYAEGEGDIDTLELHSAQQRLVETVAETDTPAVGVILAGRPRGTEAVFERLDAAVMAYLPGTAA